jgi:UDP-N-acetylglucosamine 1-carboxyvinyltransferase
MEDSFIINGGKKLFGEVNLSGAKNAALKMIIASLLFKKKVILKNIPRIKDIFELINLLKSLGVRVNFLEKNTLEIDPLSLNKNEVDLLYASKIRVSFMLFAPLLYRFSNCSLPNPGGCRIGARPIDRIVDGMKSLGVKVDYDSETGYYQATMKDKPYGSYRFSKPTHTGTELLIMLSVFGKGKIILENCAIEPEIDNLIDFLNKAGGKIKRNQDKIEIIGVEELFLNEPFEVVTDRNEAVTYACLALATGGKIKINQINFSHLKTFIEKINLAGGKVNEIKNNSLVFQSAGLLKAVSIETMPHPGFMTDWQPNWAVLMTQASGKSVIVERVFENRFSYVEELKKLGAKIKYLDYSVDDPENFYFFNYQKGVKYNQAIEIEGPTVLHNGVLNIADLRAGATLAIAALIANGQSIVNNASILERGYEDFVEKIQKIGGSIKKV